MVGLGATDAGHIYWADNTGIGRANLDGTDQEPEFLPLVSAPAARLRRGGKAKPAAKLTFTPSTVTPSSQVVDLTLRLSGSSAGG